MSKTAEILTVDSSQC